jgi:hypothetical protein
VRKISNFGFAILALMAIFYFIKVQVDSGSNYVVEDSLLGIIIFHSVFVFVAYILIAVFLISLGFKKRKRK